MRIATGRPGTDRWRRLDVVIRDAPLALALLVASLIPALHSNGTQLGDVPARPVDALGLGVVALECLPLVLRRRWPGGCLVLVSLGFALDQLRGYQTVAGTALAFALISAGAHLDRFRLPAVVLASAAYVPLALALSCGGGESVLGFVTFYLALVVAWGIGSWLRQSRAAEAGQRRRAVETTRAAERTRIARELHDVVTHHVTAMVVQTEAARYLTADRLDETLSAITDSGRRAIADLRNLLDLLDPDHHADPLSAGDLRTLVARTRQAGQPVEFTEEGRAAQAVGSAEATAYRVVREALTNALKHAHGSPTTVLVRHGNGAVTVEVGTAGARPRATPVGGLAGLRERVAVLGGEFTAGPEDGGFLVRARIPTGRAS
ncbi:histidine kinase [Amycolatopsis sp. OK19-0408]|uniref:histidine kinase n=1 Tax=Amycolatopsis iheyensis TaxID=2945988 RepID=A0A9X2SN63_9PSEU|nr:histidine kinase [Amycolatopsis iheyensis]MCR6487763.1 histidine kinase [Amycolatopsis iheyensis]